jgi:Tfp pilus assembly ATPase PilU
MTCAPSLARSGARLELLTAVMGHYQQITGRQLSAVRVMAWHVRTALGDVLWRTEAGIPLADHRTPPEWVNDVAARFRALGIAPQAGMPGLSSVAEIISAHWAISR